MLSVTNPSEMLKDVVIPLVTGFGGAIVGAAASYIPSRLLAKRASDEVLARDIAARRDQDIRAAHQVFVKLALLVNSLCGFHEQVESMIAKADREGNEHMPVWQRVSSFAGIELEPSVEFSAEELAIYIAAGQPDFVDELILLSRRHSAMLGNLTAFAKLKTDLIYETFRLGNTERAPETGVSTTRMSVSPGVANSMKARAEELELFTGEVRSMLSMYGAFARDIASRFADVTNGYLGEKSVPSFEPAQRTT